MKKIIVGDEQAFRWLIETYRNYLFQVIYSILQHEIDAEDVAQEVFVQIYLSLPSYQEKGLKTWMTRIAINKAIDFKRKRQRNKEELMDSMEEIYPNVDVDTHNLDSLFLKERKEIIAHRLDQLPPNYRVIIHAYYMEEKSYQEIAKEQGIKVKTVESKLYRARKWIRKHWKEGDF